MALAGMKGAATAALTLIALQTIATSGSGRVAGFFDDVNRLVDRAIDPNVPLIADRRTGQPQPQPQAETKTKTKTK